MDMINTLEQHVKRLIALLYKTHDAYEKLLIQHESLKDAYHVLTKKCHDVHQLVVLQSSQLSNNDSL
jgi:hypothetical protein